MVETIKTFLGIATTEYDFFIIIVCLMMIMVLFSQLANIFLFLFKWVGGIR